MLNQRVLLRIMLASLAIAAVLGAATVLVGSTDVMWRTVGTLVLVSVAALSVLVITNRMSGPEIKLAGQAAVLLVLMEFVLGLSLIWNIARTFGIEEEIPAQLMGALAGAGIPAIVFLRFLRRPKGSVAAITGLVVCAIVFGIWMVGIAIDAGILSEATSHSSWQWYCDGHAFGGMGILAAICLFGVGTDRWHWRWLGVGCAGAAAGVIIYSIHSNAPDMPEATGWLIAGAVLAAHANLAMRCPLAANLKWLAYASVAAVLATGLFINLKIDMEMGFWNRSGVYGDDALGRLAAASAILAACGTLSLAIIARMNAKPTASAIASFDNLQLSVVCPICQRKQTLGTGGGTCAGCGLKMLVKLEPPVCAACGYSLLMLKSDRCPECGAVQGKSSVILA